MERKHRALLLALPTVLTLLFFFVAPMVYILVHTLCCFANKSRNFCR